MMKRTIEISNPSHLKLKNKQLIIEQNHDIVVKVAIEDLAVLICNHYQITLSQPLVIECQKNNVILIFCDEKHLPYSCILPIAKAHSLHHKIILDQIAAKKNTKARIWQSIIKTKITEQFQTLEKFHKPSQRLKKLATQVQSNDKTNIEAIAANIYWKMLFQDSFRRSDKKNELNALLNYGYSIIRSLVARSICVAGLHPALGLYHKNQYNALALADDLMEPFRPMVDTLVYQMALEGKNQINKETKLDLLKLSAVEVKYKKKMMPLMVALGYLMADFKRAMKGEIKTLKYPKRI